MKIRDREVNRKQVFADLVAHPERLPVEGLQNDVDAMALSGPGDSGYRRMMSTLRGLRPEIMFDRDLRLVPRRSMIGGGDKDSFVPLSVGRHLAATMPEARSKQWPTLGTRSTSSASWQAGSRRFAAAS